LLCCEFAIPKYISLELAFSFFDFSFKSAFVNNVEVVESVYAKQDDDQQKQNTINDAVGQEGVFGHASNGWQSDSDLTGSGV